MSKTIVSLLFSNYRTDNRVYKMANSLCNAGHDVTVVGLLYGDVVEEETQGKIKVKRLKLSSGRLPNGNKIFGSIKYLEFFYRLISGYRKADIWHCNDWKPFFVGLIARIFNRKLQLVYDCHELQSETLGISKIEKRLVKFLERKYIHKFPVIVVGKGIKEIYQERYKLNSEQVTIIRNTPHLHAGLEKSNVLKEEFNIPKDELLFLYLGALGNGRGVNLLLEVFSELKNVHVAFMGYGIHEEKIISASQKASNIHFKPAVAYDQIMTYTSSADYGVISVENVCLNYYYCMPNKLFEYVQAEIPIFVNALFDCKRLVEEEKIGLGAEAETVEAWKEKILELSQKDPAEYSEALKRVKQKYNWENEEIKLINLYSKL